MADQNPWPTITEQRALAYAPKPFAALSFLSSLFVMYYLLIRHPEKLKRMYHRLMLATFGCFLPMSFALFMGTWAMPSGSVPWTVGAAGTSVTCSIQGFIITVFYLAFPFYYASFSVFAYVAVKNNFQEEKYVWMEKWIHVGAYLLPLALAINAAVKDHIAPGLSSCVPRANDNCDYINSDCQKNLVTKATAPFLFIIVTELAVGTFTIILLICKFDSIQKEVDAAVGMRQIVERARKHRHRQVSLQTGLYLASFWFGYIPNLIEDGLRFTTGTLHYPLVITAHCIFAFQGFIIMVIYFVLQQRSERRLLNITILGPSANDTVPNLRANAAKPRRAPRRKSSLSQFSFNIFDGTPAEDSPWRAYLDDNCSEESGLVETVIEPEEESLVASLLSPGTN